MNYKTFKSLFDEALSYDDVDEYVLHHDWSDWMNDYQENEVGLVLQSIFKMAHSPFKEIRENHKLSRAAFARNFGIPIRTAENWEYETTGMPEWQKPLLCYALFESERYE